MTSNRPTDPKLSDFIARRIFEAPHGFKRDKVQRIAFKGGTFRKETDMGGFGEKPLAKCIAKAISDYFGRIIEEYDRG